MQDLYKRLNLDESAHEAAIRERLAAADAGLRTAGEVVLLDPRRRAVYDRNRRLLLAIAQLRGELGLNYTRFWSRGEFKDFWQTPDFAAPEPQKKPGRRVDKMMIANAFHTVKHHGRHHAARWGAWWAAALLALAAAAAGAMLYLNR